MYDIVKTTDEHIDWLALNLTEADEQEVWAVDHSTPLDALTRSRQASRDTHTGLAGNDIACIFGVAQETVLDTICIPWMLCSPLLQDHWRAFSRGSREWMKIQQEEYDYLVNFVDARNTRAVRWLKWLRF